MVLRSVPMRALLAAETISTTGAQMTWLALPWFVLVTTGSPTRMSFVVAAEMSAYALFGIPSGALVARLGSRRTMLLCGAFRAPLLALVPILHWTGALTFPALLALAFAIGLFATPHGGAQRVIVPELPGDDEAEVGGTNALFQGATRITMLLGPALAGVLIGVFGAPSVLLIDAATYVVSFVLVTLFVPRVARAPEPDEPRRILDGVRFVLRDRLLRDWGAAIFLGDAAFQVIFVGIPVLVLSDYGRNARLAGLLLAAFGVGAVPGNVISYRWLERTDGLRLVARVALFQALPIWLLAAPVPAAVVALGPFLSGLANGLQNPPIHSLLTLRPPAHVRAQVITAIFTCSAVAAPVALVAAGPAFAAWGARTVLAVAAAAQTLAMILLGAGAVRAIPSDGSLRGIGMLHR